MMLRIEMTDDSRIKQEERYSSYDSAGLKSLYRTWTSPARSSKRWTESGKDASYYLF